MYHVTKRNIFNERPRDTLLAEIETLFEYYSISLIWKFLILYFLPLKGICWLIKSTFLINAFFLILDFLFKKTTGSILSESPLEP